MNALARFTLSAACLAATLAGADARAGLVGATVRPIFYADIPEANADPSAPIDTTRIDDVIAPFTIASGSSFVFNDVLYGYFGSFMQVSFSDSQIVLTNLIPGIYPEYTAAAFQFTTPVVGNVSIDASSSALFAPGSVLSFTPTSILLNLSNTCSDACVGLTDTSPGERIVLNVSPVPEPSQWALLGGGLLAVALRQRKQAAAARARHG